MKKIFTLAALAMFAFGANAQTTKDSLVVDTTYTYDFVKAGSPLTLQNFNLGWWFKAWEKEGKEDSQRQDYKGYEADENSKAVGLPDECHVWVRNPRLVQNLSEAGFRFTGEKNFVVDGLAAGDQVIFDYTADTTSTAESKAAAPHLIYATGESALTGAHFLGADTLLKAGVSVINSGDTIVVDSAEFVTSKGAADGYLAVLGYKNQYLTKVTIVKADGTKLVYDFVKAGSPLALSNNNCGWWFKAWEKEGKEDSQRQDYKGYSADGNSKAVGLPDECHVWVRNPRLVQNISSKGFRFTGEKNFVVDGLDSCDQVIFEYTADTAATATDVAAQPHLLYATGASAETVARIEGADTTLVAGLSQILSGDTITVDSANFVTSKGAADGYISVLGYKNQYLTKVTIVKRSIVKVPVVDGITNISTEKRADDPNAPIYNLAGQRVDKNFRGVVIQNGKKFFQK